jgi:hypothetical protein
MMAERASIVASPDIFDSTGIETEMMKNAEKGRKGFILLAMDVGFDEPAKA